MHGDPCHCYRFPFILRVLQNCSHCQNIRPKSSTPMCYWSMYKEEVWRIKEQLKSLPSITSNSDCVIYQACNYSQIITRNTQWPLMTDRHRIITMIAFQISFSTTKLFFWCHESNWHLHKSHTKQKQKPRTRSRNRNRGPGIVVLPSCWHATLNMTYKEIH